jgi:hypothetical protein
MFRILGAEDRRAASQSLRSELGFGGRRAASWSHAWWIGCKGLKVELNGEGVEESLE